MTGEFDLIDKYFKPLAVGAPGALGLTDDAAVIAVDDGFELVVTTDALVEGVHYRAADPPQTVAAKLLGVNLSDLAAMGARPLAYTVAAGFARDVHDDWIARFADGLAESQKRHHITLVGGDTVAAPQGAFFVLTAMGQVEQGGALTRAGARPGDRVCVSGTLGDAALGLQLLNEETDITTEKYALLVKRYQMPRPRIGLGRSLRGVAHAAVDISDGLAADLGHIAAASGVGMTISAAALPISAAARSFGAAAAAAAALCGGDDYELAFCIDPAVDLAKLAGAAALQLTAIGTVTSGSGVSVLDSSGNPLELSARGYTHF